MNPADAKRRADAIVNRRVDKLGRAAGLDLLRRLIRKTPVDTGHAEGNWNINVGSADTSVMDGRTAPMALTDGGNGVKAWKMSDGTALHVTNAVPYIIRLEEGWSQQAPNGMARISVGEMKPVIEQITRELNRG